MSTRERHSVIALLVADGCSAAAALGQETAIGKLVYDITRSKLDLGLLGLVEFAPAVVLVLATGAVADRWPRPKVAAAAMAAETVAAAGMAWYVHAQGRGASVPVVLAIVVAFGVARAFAAPAARALPADVVAADRLPWVMARSSLAFQAGIIAGPVLGGFLYTAGLAWPFVGCALILAVAAVAVSTVQPLAGPPGAAASLGTPLIEAAIEPAGGPTSAEIGPRGRGGLRDALEGLRFIRSQPALLGAISLDLFGVLFGGAVALLPAIAQDRLHTGAIGLGLLRAAAGIGAGLVTVVLAVRPVRRRVGRSLLGVVALFGTFTIVLGVTHRFAIAFAALAALSGADAISVFIRATLVPLMTPEDRRGRVLAVENVFIGASNELGAFESGVAAQLLGTGAAVVLGGAATVAVACAWAGVFPTLRDLDAFPH
jgi:MFS family permease